MIRATDIHSLTDFTRNAKSYIEQIKTTGNPIAITVNGSAEVVVQDAKAYQAIIDELETQHVLRAIAEGEADVAAGRLYPIEGLVEEIFDELGL
jgi:prevent-host-death family protein